MSKRAVLLKAVASTENDLKRMVAHLDETAVQHKPTPDQWSIADVLCHFAFVENRYLQRLQRVVNEERPFLPTIHPHETEHQTTRPTNLLLSDFATARMRTLSYLRNLKAGDWQKTAVHETWGPTTFRALVQHLVAHDTNHLNQIISLQKQVKK